MNKRIVSFALALVFVLSAFGVTSIFAGVFTEASAGYFENYVYTPLPGWDDFTSGELNQTYHDGTARPVNVSGSDLPSYAPETVTKATRFDVTNSKPGEWEGYITIGSFLACNMGDSFNMNWCPKKAPASGTTFSGGHDFSEDSGICFWIAQNEGRAYFKVKVLLYCVPCKGSDEAYKNGGEDPELADAPNGFVYEGKVDPDNDGYVYLDFKKDFYQVDWYWGDDDGVNHTCLGGDYTTRPLPDNMKPLISGITIEFRWASVGDVYYIGDFNAYKDKRMHTDELSEYVDQFDALDAEAYTEESYNAATEVYLRAYDILFDPDINDNYTQKQIDTMAKELKNAIKSLKPLFPVKNPDIELPGFDVWDEDDLDAISDGNVGIDMCARNEEVLPDGEDMSVEIVANADIITYDEPYFGWSCFVSEADDGDGPYAIKNPFGGVDMSESSGIRFWIQYPDEVMPNAMQVLIGKAGEANFYAEDTRITRPTEAGARGYVAVSWSSFDDIDGDGNDIFDYIDQLDYIGIMFEDLFQSVYYISDLHTFVWSEQNADMSELRKSINTAKNYMAGLFVDDYTPVSWQKLEAAIAAGEALFDVYGVTQDEVDAAKDEVDKRVNKLCPIGDNVPLDKLNHLYAVIESGESYWRGNYTAKSYAPLRSALLAANEATDSDISLDLYNDLIASLEGAIANLVPITHSGTIAKGLYSFESWTTRDLSKATGDRTENVSYTLAKKSESSTKVTLPDGFSQALKMSAKVDLQAGENDEHGVMQFKAMYRNSAGSPKFIEPSNGAKLVDDLTGSDGIRVWIGVNDTKLVSNGFFRFGVSNCHSGPLFENHVIDIPLPATGSGWLYLPWSEFTHYDAWTNGQPTDLKKIGFYILRFDGIVKQGLEVYVTGIQAYTGTSTTEAEQPVVYNITEGQTIDVSETPLVPEWSVGSGILDFQNYLYYGNAITTNGEHQLVITNCNKQTTVNFTVTGGEDVKDKTPTVIGVKDGDVIDLASADAPTIAFDVGAATLNGDPFESGTQVTAPGEYTLVVQNGTETVTVTFTIKGIEYATPVVTGVAEGITYEGEVTAYWDVGTATLNGEAFGEEGCGTVTAPGTYVLTVTNGDKTVTVNFTLKEKETPPAADKGDFDGDGQITVADALAALRIGAKLVEETPEAIAIGDVDNDGHVTVADALAILRVAAKLSDHL